MVPQIRVMHVTDSLDMGGMERVAVNLVNSLPRDRFRPFLCTTRSDGPLEQLVEEDVGRLRLRRSHRFDMRALRRLAEFVRLNEIRIVHSHGSSVFVAAAALALQRSARIVWHCHFGRFDLRRPPAYLYGPAANCTSGVIAVNEPMAKWLRETLRVPRERVWYIPNFVDDSVPSMLPETVPGKPGRRIVCVANFRPQKDHLSLLRALREVVRQVPDVHLLLVGGQTGSECGALVQRTIQELELTRNVSVLGARMDVAALLRTCDIGVLSSASEGLPLVLIEYGMAGLPVVATRVGQCSEVLDEGEAGILVPPGDEQAIARALVSLLCSREERQKFGEWLRRHVQRRFSASAVVGEVCSVYESVLLRN